MSFVATRPPRSMNRNVLRRGLTWCVVAIVLLPVALAVVMGLGALLAALGDAAAAAVCGRLALVLGVLVVVALVATTVANALAILAPPRRRRRRRKHHRPRSAPLPDRPPGSP